METRTDRHTVRAMDPRAPDGRWSAIAITGRWVAVALISLFSGDRSAA